MKKINESFSLLLVVIILCISVSACSDDDDGFDDADASNFTESDAEFVELDDCTVQVAASVPPVVERGSLNVRGSAWDRDGRAIRSVIVGTRSANSEEFNYRIWSVTLESSDVEALPRVADAEDDADIVEIPIYVVDHRGITCALTENRPRFELASESPEDIVDAGFEDADDAGSGDDDAAEDDSVENGD